MDDKKTEGKRTSNNARNRWFGGEPTNQVTQERIRCPEQIEKAAPITREQEKQALKAIEELLSIGSNHFSNKPDIN